MAHVTVAEPLAPAESNPVVNLFRDIFTLYRRALMKMFRVPVQLYFSLVQPLIWFLLFGQLFNRITSGFGAVRPGQANPISSQFGTDNYQAFFLAAIIIQVLIFGAANSALGIIGDDQSGYLNKLRVSPINRTAILVGNLLADLTRMLLQVVVLLVVGFIFGVRFQYPLLIPLILIIAGLFGMMMGGVGLFIGLATRNTQATFLIINFFTLPLLFTSTAQLPLQFLPDWMQKVASYNPVTYAVNSVRVIVTGLNQYQVSNGQTVASIIWSGMGILFVLAVIALTAATMRFRTRVQ
jgi:ABC-2 type transport system permease protein